MAILQPLPNLDVICIAADAVLREAVTCIDRNQRGIALVRDAQGKLVGTITDGDVRRAMLAGRTLATPVADLLEHKRSTRYPQPVTAPAGTDPAALLKMMHDLVIRQIPLVDDEGLLTGLITIEDLVPDQALPLRAVIMAGGFGTRLLPLTENMPKPMLPVGDKPLMEILIQQLRESGIHHVNVTTHFQRDKIKSHFRDGQHLGVDLTYVDEDQPLGTAGALSLMEAFDEPLLVINGDILTEVNFRAMLQFHREHHAEMTVAVRRYDVEVPYGVVQCEDANIVDLTEKPQFSFFVNAGIYLLEPSAQALLPAGEASNMTDLIQKLVAAGRPVVSFPIREYWIDIGRHADYELAQEHARSKGKG